MTKPDVAMSVPMKGSMAQCPYCRKSVNIPLDKYGTATLLSSCPHFSESWTCNDKRYATFAQGQ